MVFGLLKSMASKASDAVTSIVDGGDKKSSKSRALEEAKKRDLEFSHEPEEGGEDIVDEAAKKKEDERKAKEEEERRKHPSYARLQKRAKVRAEERAAAIPDAEMTDPTPHAPDVSGRPTFFSLSKQFEVLLHTPEDDFDTHVLSALTAFNAAKSNLESTFEGVKSDGAANDGMRTALEKSVAVEKGLQDIMAKSKGDEEVRNKAINSTVALCKQLADVCSEHGLSGATPLERSVMRPLPLQLLSADSFVKTTAKNPSESHTSDEEERKLFKALLDDVAKNDGSRQARFKNLCTLSAEVKTLDQYFVGLEKAVNSYIDEIRTVVVDLSKEIGDYEKGDEKPLDWKKPEPKKEVKEEEKETSVAPDDGAAEAAAAAKTTEAEEAGLAAKTSDTANLENLVRELPMLSKVGTKVPADKRAALKWLSTIHKECTKHKSMAGIVYTATQVRIMLYKGEICLRRMLDARDDRRDVFEELLKNRVDLDHCVDLCFALFIYTVDCKDCSCKSIDQCEEKRAVEKKEDKPKHRKDNPKPTNNDAHGYNSAPWAVANWTLRVANDPTSSAKVVADASATITDFFQPFIDRLDEALSMLPQERKVVFRGVPRNLSRKYHLDTVVVFAPFTSTSLVGTEAQKFMARGSEGTFFIIRIHSAGMIDFMSWFPEQAEALAKTYTAFHVKTKASRTLMQMLGCKYDIVTMSEVGGETSPQEKADALYYSALKTVFIYEDYLNRYVEGAVSTRPPPQTQTTPLFDVVAEWLDSNVPNLFLLGSGGSGKTSATLGCLSNMMKNNALFSDRPCLPFFIPLPSISNLGTRDDAIDAHIESILDIGTEALEILFTKYVVVLLLDSLDEVAASPADMVYFLDKSKWCKKAKVVVSCRDEYFVHYSDTQPQAFLSKAGGVNMQYVQPFSNSDLLTFVAKAVKTDCNGDMSGLKEHERPKALLRELRKMAVGDAALRHPCTLHIALHSVRHCSKFLPTETRSQITDVYDAFLQGSLSEAGLADVPTSELIAGLEGVAMTMLRTNSWTMTVSQFMSHFKKLSETDARKVLSATPRRCEDDYDNASVFSFWHKSLAEYLCARAIYRCPDVLAEVSQFISLRSPLVLRYFEKLATASPPLCERFAAIVRPSLLKFIAGAKLSLADSNAASAIPKKQQASNALALACAARMVFDRDSGVSLEGLRIEQCNLAYANLCNADLRNIEMKDCVLTGASMDGALVDKANFPNCDCGVKLAPIKSPGNVKVISFSTDKKTLIAVSAVGSGRMELERDQIDFYHPTTGESITRKKGLYLSHSQDGKYVVYATDRDKWDSSIKVINVYDVKEKKVVKSLDAYQEVIIEIKGMLMKDYKVWLGDKGQSEVKLTSCKPSWHAAEFTHDNKYLVVVVTIKGEVTAIPFNDDYNYTVAFSFDVAGNFTKRPLVVPMPKVLQYGWLARYEGRWMYLRPVGGQHMACVAFDVVTGKPLHPPETLKHFNNHSISPDGTMVAEWGRLSQPDVVSVRLVTDKTGSVVASLVHEGRKPTTAQFTLSNREVFTACGDSAYLWDISTGSTLAHFTAGDCVVNAAASDLSNIAVCGYTTGAKNEKRHKIFLYDGSSSSSAEDHFNGARARIVHSTGDTSIPLPNSVGMNQLRATVSSDNSFLTIMHEKGFLVNKIPSGRVNLDRKGKSFFISNDSQWALLGQKASAIFAGSEIMRLQVIATQTNQDVRTFHAEEECMKKISLGSLNMFKTFEALLKRTIDGEVTYSPKLTSLDVVFHAACITPDSKFIIIVALMSGVTVGIPVGDDVFYTSVSVYATSNFKCRFVVSQKKKIESWVVRYNGAYLVLKSPIEHKTGDVRVLDFHTQQIVDTPQVLQDNFKTGVFSHDGTKLATIVDDTMVAVATIAKEDVLASLVHEGKVTSISFTAADTEVCTTVDNDVIVWDIRSGDQIAKYTLKDTPKLAVAREHTFVSAITKGPALFFCNSGEGGWNWGQPATEGHSMAVMATLKSSTGDFFYSAGKDNCLIQWDSATGRELQRFDLQDDFVAMRFSPKNTFIVVQCKHSMFITDFKYTNARTRFADTIHDFSLNGNNKKIAIVLGDAVIVFEVPSLKELFRCSKPKPNGKDKEHDIVAVRFGGANDDVLVSIGRTYHPKPKAIEEKAKAERAKASKAPKTKPADGKDEPAPAPAPSETDAPLSAEALQKWIENRYAAIVNSATTGEVVKVQDGLPLRDSKVKKVRHIQPKANIKGTAGFELEFEHAPKDAEKCMAVAVEATTGACAPTQEVINEKQLAKEKLQELAIVHNTVHVREANAKLDNKMFVAYVLGKQRAFSSNGVEGSVRSGSAGLLALLSPDEDKDEPEEIILPGSTKAAPKKEEPKKEEPKKEEPKKEDHKKEEPKKEDKKEPVEKKK